MKFADREESYAPDLDDSANDDWQSRRAGFRIDSESGSTKWTLQGDTYDNLLEQTIDEIWRGPSDPKNTSPIPGFASLDNNVADTARSKGHNLLGKWENQLDTDSLATVQLYFDHIERSEEFAGQDIKTYDLDVNHSFTGIQDHQLIWGLGYRCIDDKFDGTYAVSAFPSELTSELFSGFIQDEVALQDNLWLTIGTKLEHNSYTDFEIQPSKTALVTRTRSESVDISCAGSENPCNY